MLVRTNLETRRVVISGRDGTGSYEISLTWSQAALLSTLLNAGSREIAPELTFGRRYEPAIERDR